MSPPEEYAATRSLRRDAPKYAEAVCSSRSRAAASSSLSKARTWPSILISSPFGVFLATCSFSLGSSSGVVDIVLTVHREAQVYSQRHPNATFLKVGLKIIVRRVAILGPLQGGGSGSPAAWAPHSLRKREKRWPLPRSFTLCKPPWYSVSVTNDNR